MSDTQTPARSWCETLQKKLMDAIDAAWAVAKASDDPAVIARARDKARLAGQMAAEARKIAALVPPPRAETARTPPALITDALDRVAEASPAPAPVTQAEIMRAALARVRRR